MLLNIVVTPNNTIYIVDNIHSDSCTGRGSNLACRTTMASLCVISKARHQAHQHVGANPNMGCQAKAKPLCQIHHEESALRE